MRMARGQAQARRAGAICLLLGIALGACEGGDDPGAVLPPAVAPAVRAFPAGFRFGAATSAHQVEGGQQNNWTLWETLPAFAGLTREPAGRAVDHFHRYEEDLDLVRWMGLDVFRMSVEWSRIEPERGEYDAAAIEHYRRVFQAMRARGIRPSVTLHHFTEPQWFADLRVLHPPFDESFCPDGPSDRDFCFWGNPDAPAVFGAFCGRMAEAYGAYVDEWMTVNELTGHWLNTSVTGSFPPGLTAFTPERMRDQALPVLRGLLAAHAACYRAIHAADRIDADGDGLAARVGLTTGTGAVRPANPANPGDVAAARQAESLATFLAFDAVTRGRLDADLDGVPEEEHPEWANTLDLLGLQYYASTVIVGFPLAPPPFAGIPCLNLGSDLLVGLERLLGCPAPPTQDFPLVDDPPTEVYGRQHDPEGLLEVMRLLALRYLDLPVVITENGFADDDEKRASSIVRHLDACHRALEEGIPLEGYYHWSLLDNFEWGRGFAVRFGLIRVDYDDDLRRIPTVAARVYREIARSRGLRQEHLDERGGPGPLP